MPLINRLSRLFQADMNAVLDQIEEPEILLRQAIRDMQETLTQQEIQIKLAEYEHQQLVKKDCDIKQVLTELEEQLVICFKSDKDELAHGLVKRKLEINQNLKVLTAKIVSSQELTGQLSIKLKEHQAQLNSMQQKADLFTPEKISSSSSPTWDPQNFNISEEDIEIAFLQEKQNWSRS